MYKWDKDYINLLIKHSKKRIKNIKDNELVIEIINDDIQSLKELKSIIPDSLLIKKDIKDNIASAKEEYKTLKHYNNIINPIITKYQNEPHYNINYKKIITSQEEILLFTLDNIRNINKKWGELLEPWITNKYTINFKKNNYNYIITLRSIKQYFVSLNKNNNICDYVDPTHEFLHILWFIINHNAFSNIERESLSILGEFITTYEMKNNNIFNEETRNYNIANINRLFTFISNIQIKKNIAKKNYVITYSDLDIINNIFLTSITYDYQTIISYLLAIELFEIYKIDKEKCIYIVENIIKSNDKLNKKLKDNNIILNSNDEKYIKQLKKEYETINNL